MLNSRMIALLALTLLPSAAVAQSQPGQPTPSLTMGRATIQIRGSKESDMPVLLSRQLAVGWSTTQGLWDSLWVGTNGKGNIKIWPQPPQVFPLTLPPSGPAGGRLAGTYPNPTLAPSGVTPNAYGGTNKTVAFQVDAAGTILSATTYDIAFPPFPAIPVVPSTLPPSGPASGDLTGTYPAPSLVSIGTAKTVGSSTQIPVVTIDAKGRVTALTSVAPPVDPFTAKFRSNRVALGGMLVGAIQDVVVTFSTPFADTNYTVTTGTQSTGALAGVLDIQGVTTMTASTVTVRVKAVGLLNSGITLHVIAIHD